MAPTLGTPSSFPLSLPFSDCFSLFLPSSRLSIGQTGVTFVMQILGSGGGSILGMIISYIAKDVGGYAYNPFVLTCLLALVAVPCSYIIYTRPMYFAGALLMLNSAGLLVITEASFSTFSPAFLVADACVFTVHLRRRPSRLDSFRLRLSRPSLRQTTRLSLPRTRHRRRLPRVHPPSTRSTNAEEEGRSHFVGALVVHCPAGLLLGSVDANGRGAFFL
jgi:hypothetical protein